MDISSIPGLGPKRTEALQKSGFNSMSDLLYNIPRTWLDQTKLSRIADLQVGQNAVLVGKVIRAGIIRGRTSRFMAVLSDGSGEITLTFFKGVVYWSKAIRVLKRYVVIGQVADFKGIQMVHPDMRALKDSENYEGEIIPVYSISEVCHAAKMEQHFFRQLYKKLFAMPSVSVSKGAPRELTDFLRMRPIIENLRHLHLPKTLPLVYESKRQLKILELLPFCLRMVTRRRALLARGSERSVNLGLVMQARSALKFSLTHDQESALNEILAGLNGKRQFHALLQGDVGSGKTVVAMLAMLAVCGSSEQVALMVPTDILARQHFSSIEPFFKAAGLRVEMLLGSMTAASRREILSGLCDGSIHAVIGTHALFSEDVIYAKLGFVIIDEQHRFGVNQREALLAKGHFPDLLVMSATPIPRSLAMTIYGDLHTIVIKEKPPGRKPVKTRVLSSSKREDMKHFLLKEIQNGNRCYWVASRVEADTENSNILSVGEIVHELQNFSSEWKVAGVHGQMDETEREQILKNFAAGSVQVLVATTVIEVGVNVPEANLMVIDCPERFGLAQLHQLRGRVGRGSIAAWCFLICDSEDTAKERLLSFASTEDGFEIAEMDLKTRGAGNLEGSEQSGAWVFRWFDWIEDRELIAKTLETAEIILDNRDRFSPEGLQKIQQWYKELPTSHRDGIH